MTDYTNYKTEDLLLDESFVSFCKGNDSETNSFWEKFLLDHPEMLAETNKARKLYSMLSVSVPREEKAGRISQLKVELNSGKHETQPISKETPVYSITPQRKIGWRRYAVAIAIAGLLITAALWYISSFGGKHPSAADYANAKFTEGVIAKEDQRRELKLPDGSIVELNNGSTLKIADNYNKKERWVYLEGEAFFSVRKDADKPFVVITSKTATTALGTSFKVRNYAGDQKGSVMLATGKVKVESLEEDSKNADLFLLPGEEAAWNGNEQPVKSVFDQEALQDWRNTRIIFEKADLARIIETLEFYYGVQVVLANKPRTPIAFTGKFSGKSLKEMLEAIGFANKFNYWQRGNIVSIVF